MLRVPTILTVHLLHRTLRIPPFWYHHPLINITVSHPCRNCPSISEEQEEFSHLLQFQLLESNSSSSVAPLLRLASTR